jgi:hypothetical protein
MVKAEAVAAVRSGLRAAFARPSAPGSPQGGQRSPDCAGQPSGHRRAEQAQPDQS